MNLLGRLVGLFYSNPSELGRFTEIDADALPAIPHRLLAHNRHMTTTLEAQHRSPVRVDVLQTATESDRYWRKILLRKTADDSVVLFGVVRVDFRYMDAQVRDEIERRTAPVGRVLVEHDVMRSVEIDALWRINPATELRDRLKLTVPTTLYGRTAVIHCNGEAAIELLEVVAPA